MSWQWLIAAFLFLVGMGFYFPIIYIRKANRMLEILEQIERNTRYALGPESMERYITRGVMADAE